MSFEAHSVSCALRLPLVPTQLCEFCSQACGANGEAERAKGRGSGACRWKHGL